jgi:hypothetical protein
LVLFDKWQGRNQGGGQGDSQSHPQPFFVEKSRVDFREMKNIYNQFFHFDPESHPQPFFPAMALISGSNHQILFNRNAPERRV